MSNKENQDYPIKDSDQSPTQAFERPTLLEKEASATKTRAAFRKKQVKYEKALEEEQSKQKGSNRTERRKNITEEKKKLRVRLIPIWLRLIIIIVVSAACLVAGAMVGYGVIGNGKPMDVLKIDTWHHIIDVVDKGK